MMLPTEVVALAEARREAFERELQLQRKLALLPRAPSRWRTMTGGSLMWAGAQLVRWGNGVAMTNRSQTVQGLG